MAHIRVWLLYSGIVKIGFIIALSTFPSGAIKALASKNAFLFYSRYPCAHPLGVRVIKAFTLLKNAPGVFFETGSHHILPLCHIKKGPLNIFSVERMNLRGGLMAHIRVCHPSGAIKALASKNAFLHFFRNWFSSHTSSLPYKKRPTNLAGLFLYGREEGIRTLDTVRCTRFPGELFQPLRHLSKSFSITACFWYD